MGADGIAVSPDDIDTWLGYDDPVPTADSLTDDDIIASVTADDEQDTESETADDADAAGSGTCVKVPTPREAAQHLEQALLWFETTQIDSLKIMQLRNLVTIAKRAQCDGQKQTKLTSFFTRA